MSIYQVWRNKDNTSQLVARFKSAKEAQRFIEDYSGEQFTGTLEIVEESKPIKKSRTRKYHGN